MKREVYVCWTAWSRRPRSLRADRAGTRSLNEMFCFLAPCSVCVIGISHRHPVTVLPPKKKGTHACLITFLTRVLVILRRSRHLIQNAATWTEHHLLGLAMLRCVRSLIIDMHKRTLNIRQSLQLDLETRKKER